MGDDRILKEIGKRINNRRKELYLTQEMLAEKMEVSVQMISNLELGKKAIRPENIIKLCDVLNVSADYVLRGKHSEYEYSIILDKYKNLSVENQHLIDELITALL